MKAKERREQILGAVDRNGFMSVPELSRLLDVSEVTIRADLTHLSERSSLKRGYGGAFTLQSSKAGFPPDNATVWSPTQYSTAMAEEKVMIAKRAALLVKPNDIVLLDGSNTSYFLARELALDDRRLIMVTNSTDIIDVLRPAANKEIILLGGEYHPKFNATFGSLTEAEMRGIHASKAFLSPKSLDAVRGALLDSSMVSSLRRVMLESSRECYLLADHSKFTGNGIFHLADWSEVTGLVTDRLPPPAFQEALSSKGIPCHLPDAG